MANDLYIAVTLFAREHSDKTIGSLYQENIMLVRAESEDEARSIVNNASERENSAYKNEDGDDVAWTFVRTVDVAPALYDDLSEPCVDLYTRHFSDMEAYEAFDRGPFDPEEK